MTHAARADESPQGDRGGAVALAWLAHPVTVLAIAVLVLNDHALKTAYPGLVTGKLSDLAGLVLAPPLLAVVATLVVPWLSVRAAAIVGLVGTALGFTAVKATAAGAASASAAWSAVALPTVIRADATDLLTLPALLLAWWVWTRARRRPVAHRLVRLARALVVLPAGVLAVAATSVDYPQAVAVAPWRGGIVVGEVNAYAQDPDEWHWARYSVDGGQTWRWLEHDGEFEQASEEVDRAAGERTQACLPDDRTVCYRVVPGHLRVEQTRDGGATWTTSWDVTAEQRQRLARHYPGLDDPAADLSSHALMVSAADGGHIVLVANGRDGYALREVDGRWQRIGFGMNGDSIPHWDDPLPTAGTWAPYGWLWGQVGAVLAGLVIVEVAGRQGRRRLLHVPGLVLIGAGLAAQFATTIREAEPSPLASLGYGLAIALTLVGLAVWLGGLASGGMLSGVQSAVAVPAALVAGLVVSVPLLIWQHPGATAAAVLLWGLGTALAAMSVTDIGRDRPLSPSSRSPDSVWPPVSR